MRITDRDRVLLEDVGLHQVMTRDQILNLGYFGSVVRTNARLLALVRAGLLTRISAPVLSSTQTIYSVRKAASPWIEPRIANLLASRSSRRPKHLEHCLATTDVRLHLSRLGMTTWLAESQVRHQYCVSTATKKSEELRPDGLAIFQDRFLFLEVDRGNTSLSRFKAKFDSYTKYERFGLFTATYNASSFAVLFVTTGGVRASSLRAKSPTASTVRFCFCTFRQLEDSKTIQEVLLP